MSYAQVLQITDRLFNAVWAHLKMKKLCPSLCWCITRDCKVYARWKGRKEGYSVCCNFMPEKCAVWFIISFSWHINLFSSASMTTSTLHSSNTDANVICFLAVSGTPHNDQYYACAYRSEQVGTCMPLRVLFSSPEKRYGFDNIYISQYWKTQYQWGC